MDGFPVEYEYEGDEAAWKSVIDEFLRDVAADPRLSPGFRYLVFVKADGKSRVHVPSWDPPKTLAHLQSQPFFKTFSAAIKLFAGSTLRTTKLRAGGHCARFAVHMHRS